MITGIILFLNNYKKIINLSIISLLIILCLFFSYMWKSSLKDIQQIKEDRTKELLQIKLDNQIILKKQSDKYLDIVQQYNENSEKRANELKNIQNSIDKSNDISRSLYDETSRKISGISSNTSKETIIRYLNVSDESYRETNEAYGEAAESLERGKIELNKCISDIDSIYSINASK